MFTPLNAFVAVVLLAYLVVGLWLYRYYPLKSSKDNKLDSILTWPLVYQSHFHLLLKTFSGRRSYLVRLYLLEEWEKLIEITPIWTKKSDGKQYEMYLILPVRASAKSVEWPAFTGYDTDSQEGRRRLDLITKDFHYEPNPVDKQAEWILPSGLDSRRRAVAGEIVAHNVSVSTRAGLAPSPYTVITPGKLLSQFEPW